MQPLGGAVHSAGQASRSRADDDQVIEGLRSPRMQARLLGQLRDVGIDQGTSVGKEDDGQPDLLLTGRLHQRQGFLVPLDVQPLIGDLTPGQEILDRVGVGRPERSGNANAFKGHVGTGQPIVEQIVQHRIEVLLWGAPRLHQVVVQPDGVDRGDGRLRVGVGREQHLPGIRVEGHRLR